MTAAEAPAGAPRSYRQWSGPGGLAGFRALMPCTTRDPFAFRVQVQQVRFAGLRLEDWRTSELALDGRARDEVVLGHVLAGAVRCTESGVVWSASPGRLIVLAAGRHRRWALAAGTRLRLVGLPVALVPGRLLRSPVSGAVPESAVTAAFLVALGGLSEAGLRGPVPSGFVGQGLHALALAVLDERRRVSGDTSDDLRDRIERYVDQHLGDPDLAPGSIAEAFAISLRRVHQAFDCDGRTLAQHIRVLRADAVADEVVRTGSAASTSTLAAAYGFSGRDHLGRVFRARYGMTVAEFQGAVHVGARPVALQGHRADAD